jgi:hypothetical protein
MSDYIIKKGAGKRGSFSLGDVLLERGRLRSPESEQANKDKLGAKKSSATQTSLSDVKLADSAHHDDIGNIWAEQKRLREQDSLLEIEYRQAKEKAKQIKSQLKQNKLGDESLLGDELSKYIPKVKGTLKAKISKRAAGPKDQTPKLPLSNRLHFTKKHLIVGGLVSVVVLSLGLRLILSNKSSSSDGNSKDTSAILGKETDIKAADLPEVTQTDFNLLYPAGMNPANAKIVRISPENAAVVYSYVDKLDEAQLRISQQRVPDEFKPGVDAAAQELAKGFNLNSVIQVDSIKVYHGYNDKNDVTQSLMFIKNDLLILIAASQKLSDDKWASYIGTFR